MRYNELSEKEWNEKSPLENTPDPLDWWGPTEREMLERYSEVKTAKTITNYEAAMLIGADNEMSYAIFDYKQANTVIKPEDANNIASILQRVKPIDQTFYRGTYQESKHPMPFRSWSANQDTAEYFAEGQLHKTVGPVRGVELGNIFYWHDSLYGGGSGLGDIQAEWFLLEPKSKRIR